MFNILNKDEILDEVIEIYSQIAENCYNIQKSNGVERVGAERDKVQFTNNVKLSKVLVTFCPKFSTNHFEWPPNNQVFIGVFKFN